MMKNDQVKKELDSIYQLLFDLQDKVRALSELVVEEDEDVKKAEKELDALLPDAPSNSPVSNKNGNSVSKEMVRGALAKLASSGHKDIAKQLLKSHGAVKLSEIPSDEYAALYEEATNALKESA